MVVLGRVLCGRTLYADRGDDGERALCPPWRRICLIGGKDEVCGRTRGFAVKRVKWSWLDHDRRTVEGMWERRRCGAKRIV